MDSARLEANNLYTVKRYGFRKIRGGHSALLRDMDSGRLEADTLYTFKRYGSSEIRGGHTTLLNYMDPRI